MKNTIEYYYDLIIDKLYIENNVYHFTIDKVDYYFLPFLYEERSINKVIEYISFFKEKNINCHDLKKNIKNSYLTKIDEVNYVLMNVVDKDREYTIFDMLELIRKVNIFYDNYTNNWAMLWSKKIDYIENQISEIKVDRIINASIDYYIGLAENSIYYVNIVNREFLNDNPTLCHKRVYYPNVKLNYLNPLSFIIDLEVRDIAEYLKSMFWAREDAFGELQAYLKTKKLTPYSYNMLFARLLYPSYYFDVYEKVVNSKDNSEKIIRFLNGINEYESFLKKAYKEISLYAKLLNIEWIIY